MIVDHEVAVLVVLVIVVVIHQANLADLVDVVVSVIGIASLRSVADTADHLIIIKKVAVFIETNDLINHEVFLNKNYLLAFATALAMAGATRLSNTDGIT
jgi:hypothetical protein